MEVDDTPLAASEMVVPAVKEPATPPKSRPESKAANVVTPAKKPTKKPRVFDIFDVDFDSMDDVKEKYALYIDDGSVPCDPNVIVTSLLKKATKGNIQKLIGNNPSLFSDLKLASSAPKDTFVNLVAERFMITLQLLSGENTPMHILNIKS